MSYWLLGHLKIVAILNNCSVNNAVHVTFFLLSYIFPGIYPRSVITSKDNYSEG